ncbi:MAG: glycerol-3-phosphate acyltransferase [Chloroflexi bacterium]|nr:glycerol-3-phosphate acyltransferase [Chloroflexota bacterium]
MTVFIAILTCALGYLLGSIPFGLLVVRLATGQDVRQVGSGRTGGTNAMRAGGLGVGLLTTVLDIFKGALAVWLARSLVIAQPWIEALAGLASVLGHNYSLFLVERVANATGRRRLQFRGGAGGAPTVGAAVAFWAPSTLIIVPFAAAVFYFVGYASVTTMSVGALAFVIFTLRAVLGFAPWAQAVFALAAEAALIWALRPNLQRLAKGTERLHGWRARRSAPPEA